VVWRIQDFRLGGQVERASIEAPRGWSFGDGCPPPMGRGLLPRKFLDFFASQGCILRAFCHVIRQFTTPVLIRLKPVKSSDISSSSRAKSSSGYVSVALVCLFVSMQDWAYSKSYERILMKFSGAVRCTPGRISD